MLNIPPQFSHIKNRVISLDEDEELHLLLMFGRSDFVVLDLGVQLPEDSVYHEYKGGVVFFLKSLSIDNEKLILVSSPHKKISAFSNTPCIILNENSYGGVSKPNIGGIPWYFSNNNGTPYNEHDFNVYWKLK